MKAILCAIAFTLPLAAHAGTISVDSALGPVEVESQPAKVVALDIAAMDTLSALGVTLIGRPDFRPPSYLQSSVAEVPTMGTLFEPDFEALAVAAPDLIIAGGRSQSQVPALGRLAPTLDMTISGANLIGDARARIDSYGQLFARADEAAALEAGLDKAIEDARAAVDGKGDAMILLTNGGKISAYGAGSRFGWLHDALDLPEAYPDLKVGNHGEAVSFEFISKADPDWLLVIDRGAAVGQEGAAAAATLDNPLVRETKAGRNGQIIYLDPAAMYLSGGGVQSLMRTLEQVREGFSGANG